MTQPTRRALINIDNVFLAYVDQHGSPLLKAFGQANLESDPLQVAAAELRIKSIATVVVAHE